MKLVKIDSCKNIFFYVVLVFVPFFNVTVLFSNAYGDSINITNLSNHSDVQDSNRTTNSQFPLEISSENNHSNKVMQKFFAQIKQTNDSKAIIEVFPLTSHPPNIKDDSNSSKSDLLSLSRNDILNEANNTKLLPPALPTISYIENEGAPMNTTNFIIKDNAVNTSEEEDDDESNRNTSEEEDDDESNRNTSEEEDDDESNRNTSVQTTTTEIYKKPNIVSTDELIGTKTIGNSIDNENEKLISQFSELNSSVIPDLQILTDDSNSQTKDRKPIANAGLDQVITNDQNIVLDASASFDPEGKISSYLWKQIGNSDIKINSSNSMIYSFPIPEDLEENSLQFKLIVTDTKGQIDTDTINFLINPENGEKSKT